VAAQNETPTQEGDKMVFWAFQGFYKNDIFPNT
jgi:hypothetical protein